MKNATQRSTLPSASVPTTQAVSPSPAVNRIFGRLVRRYAAVAVLSAALAVGGCVPYKKPVFEEIAPNETGFLIPLDDDPKSGQTKFESEAYLESRKVATKRQLIDQRWLKTGYFWLSGQYIPTQRLIKVSRSPITRVWTQSASTGTSTRDESIHVESRDSVNVSIGFTLTMLIPEEQTARFLYFYPSGGLAGVMDAEARSRLQQSVQTICSKYSFDELRNYKQEITDNGSRDLKEFYLARGVQVTTLGMVGGLSYQNPAIQRAIDESAIAQQLKSVNQAKFEAQKRENDRRLLEAETNQAVAIREAETRAAIAQKEAESRANAIKAVNAALAQTSPFYVQLQQIEMQRELAARWNGSYPATYFSAGAGSGGQGPLMLLQVPAAAATPAAPR